MFTVILIEAFVKNLKKCVHVDILVSQQRLY